jgi:uncharacterized protein YdeI (YjbR/CyaY-like superfamily)
MAKKDPRVDDYIEKSAEFARPILKHLRRVVHLGCPQVQETIKWSFPHFDYKAIMCGMAAFKHHCAFGFWKAELVFPGDKRAKKEAMGHFGRITSLADLPPEKTLIGYVRKAADLNDAGVKSPARAKPNKKPPTEIPAYFTAALNKNPKARKTFENFSPSNQREYLEWVSEAKRDQTREQRLKTSISWLAEGKPRNWKYIPDRRR